MKKNFLKILASALAVLTLASCNQTPSGDPADTTPADTTPPAQTEVNPGIDVMKFELSKCVKVPELDSLTIENNVYCDDEALESIIKNFAKDSGFIKQIKDRETKEGDTLNISYAGSIDGVYFEGGTSENASITLTEKTGYIDGFDADLYGIMPGTKVSTRVTFPDDYGATSLAGLEAVFEITVNYICDYYMTDEEVNSVTEGQYKTVEEFSAYVRESTIKENLKNYESNLADKLTEALIFACEIIEYPSELTYYYYNDMLAYYQEMADYYSLPLESLLSYYGIAVEDLAIMARDYSREDLALHAIFVKCGLVLTETDYRIKLTEMANAYGYPSADALESQYGEYFLKNMIRKDMCVEYMLKKVNIVTDYDQYKHLLEAEDTTAEVTN